MNHKALIGGLAAVLFAASACSSATNTNNTANANKPAASPAATAAPAAAASPAAPASTAGAQDFTLVNNTGVEIDKLYVAPHASDDWEEDVLGQDTLPTGQSVEIKFSRDEKAAMWDLRIEDSKGTSIEWENLNLLEISKLTLNYKDGKATAVSE